MVDNTIRRRTNWSAAENSFGRDFGRKKEAFQSKCENDALFRSAV